jgi:hypothetical protein
MYAFVNYDMSSQGVELSDYDSGKYLISGSWTHYDKQEVCAESLSVFLGVSQPACNSTGSLGRISSRIQPKDNSVLRAGYRFFDDKSLDVGALPSLQQQQE